MVRFARRYFQFAWLIQPTLVIPFCSSQESLGEHDTALDGKSFYLGVHLNLAGRFLDSRPENLRAYCLAELRKAIRYIEQHEQCPPKAASKRRRRKAA